MIGCSDESLFSLDTTRHFFFVCFFFVACQSYNGIIFSTILIKKEYQFSRLHLKYAWPEENNIPKYISMASIPFEMDCFPLFFNYREALSDFFFFNLYSKYMPVNRYVYIDYLSKVCGLNSLQWLCIFSCFFFLSKTWHAK